MGLFPSRVLQNAEAIVSVNMGKYGAERGKND